MLAPYSAHIYDDANNGLKSQETALLCNKHSFSESIGVMCTWSANYLLIHESSSICEDRLHTLYIVNTFSSVPVPIFIYEEIHLSPVRY